MIFSKISIDKNEHTFYNNRTGIILSGSWCYYDELFTNYYLLVKQSWR